VQRRAVVQSSDVGPHEGWRRREEQALLSVEVDILFSPQPIGSEHENRDLLYNTFNTKRRC